MISRNHRLAWITCSFQMLAVRRACNSSSVMGGQGTVVTTTSWYQVRVVNLQSVDVVPSTVLGFAPQGDPYSTAVGDLASWDGSVNRRV